VTADIHVEVGVGAHIDDATVAWTFDIAHWGLCGQGTDEQSAVEHLAGPAHAAYRGFLERHGESCPEPVRGEVVERVVGDEQAFQRDREPATDAELERTVQIHAWARADLLALLADATEAELDHDDPARIMPVWAPWRTIRQTARHIADTESRYYLAMLGVPPPERDDDLSADLDRSAAHVHRVLPTLPRDLVRTARGEVWTTRKALRRLACHERGEVDAMRALLRRIRELA
jgi:hypothetical protein